MSYILILAVFLTLCHISCFHVNSVHFVLRLLMSVGSVAAKLADFLVLEFQVLFRRLLDCFPLFPLS